MMIYTKEFWKDTAERVLCTIAETAVGVLGAHTLIEQINIKAVVSAALLSGAVTILKCIIVATRKES